MHRYFFRTPEQEAYIHDRLKAIHDDLTFGFYTTPPAGRPTNPNKSSQDIGFLLGCVEDLRADVASLTVVGDPDLPSWQDLADQNKELLAKFEEFKAASSAPKPTPTELAAELSPEHLVEEFSTAQLLDDLGNAGVPELGATVVRLDATNVEPVTLKYKTSEPVIAEDGKAYVTELDLSDGQPTGWLTVTAPVDELEAENAELRFANEVLRSELEALETLRAETDKPTTSVPRESLPVQVALRGGRGEEVVSAQLSEIGVSAGQSRDGPTGPTNRSEHPRRSSAPWSQRQADGVCPVA